MRGFLDTFSWRMLDYGGVTSVSPKDSLGGLQLYAIIESGGKQYRVSPGTTLRIEKVPGQKGDTYVFDKVLAVVNDDKVEFGKPYLEGAKVEGVIIRQGKARKILVFKYKAKSNYRRRYGHRQSFTEVRIGSIQANG